MLERVRTSTLGFRFLVWIDSVTERCANGIPFKGSKGEYPRPGINDNGAEDAMQLTQGAPQHPPTCNDTRGSHQGIGRALT